MIGTRGPDWHDEDASATLWALGLSVMILMLGVLTVDLWQVLAVRSEVAGNVDAAVAAGASGVDQAVYRATGEVLLDEELAVGRAAQVLPAQDLDVWGGPGGSYGVAVAASSITVVGTQDVAPVLLRLLAPGAKPFRIEVSRTAEARIDG